MPDRLKSALVTRGHTRALKDGRVRPGAFTLEFEEVPAIISAFRRMVRGLAFDVSEMALTTYICARAHGKRFTALPVFLVRAFHHGAILLNREAGVTNPKDLEGRSVGVNRGYTVTTGLWARSILQDEHDVDLRRIRWVLSGDEHVAEYLPPANVVPLEAGLQMEQELTSGRLPAAIGVSVEAPNVGPLIPMAFEAGLAALRDRGLYPINHTLVVKDELLAEHPGLAGALFDAFAEAKRGYVADLQTRRPEELSGEDAFYRRMMDVIGDPLPYGIEPNRPMLEAIIRHSLAQGIISTPVSPEDLFSPSTHRLMA
ncbi:MAG: ABC transporter substrate-binding protein [Vicinamibacterales bacterium]